MKITFLGTAGSMITKSRTNLAVLVDEDLLIDCGEGTSQKLLAILGDLSKIETILISHGHADHIMGITSLLWAMWLVSKRTKDLKIIGPEYIETLVTSLLKLGYTPLDRLTFKINYELDTSSENIFFKATLHNPTNFAYRIERRGKSLCYTGDTAPCEGLVELAEKCDVLIHEAAFPDELSNLAHKLNHSTPSDAGQLASKANVRILALVHWPDIFEGSEYILINQARKSFDGEIILAKDLDVLDV